MSQTDDVESALTDTVSRSAEPHDAEELSALNNTATPAVPHTSPSEMGALIDMSSWSQVIVSGGEIVGFVLCVMPGVSYQSENYRYFEERYRSHLYIDRIVIDSTKRGLGLGSMLYREVFSRARSEGMEFVTCEVNLDPPNPLSAQFHHKMGFVQVGTQHTKGGAVTVSLLAAPVGELGG